MREQSVEPNRVSLKVEAGKKAEFSTNRLSYRTPFLCAIQHRIDVPKTGFARASRLAKCFGCFLGLILLGSGGAHAVTLAWNAVTNVPVSGYRVYQGNSSGIYTRSTNVGNATQAVINGLTNGVTYYFAATAVSSNGVESGYSGELVYTVPLTTNGLPTIQLTAPVAGAVFTEPASVSLAVSVVANGQTVTKVQYYNGTTLLGESTAAPYSFTWNNVLAGNYSVSARLLYDASGVANSPAVAVSVGSSRPPPPAGPAVALTSPTNGASFAASANINLGAGVTANGFTISKVQFYIGASLVSESTAAPYTAIWSNATAGTYTLIARAVYGAGSTTDSPPVSITVTNAGGLPPPWLTRDVGTISAAGNVSVASGAYTVSGAGTLGGFSDAFRFLYQPLSGDGEIRAQITSFASAASSGLAGVMIRESLTAGARYGFLGVSASGTFSTQQRMRTYGKATTGTHGAGKFPSVWVRLVRKGNTLTSYSSADGVTWALVDSRSVGMASQIYLGLAVASGQSSRVGTAAFSNVTAVP
jgi:Big-like domain-containing protein/fibronectin type III domain protein